MDNTVSQQPISDLPPLLPQTVARPRSKSRFKQKVEFELKLRNYTVKTASTFEEYKQAFQLRFKIFYQEMAGYCEKVIGYDYDVYDELGDLILIIDQRTEQIIGTYRIIASDFSERFYSQSEFDLSVFLDTNAAKCEVSRACIHADHRNGVTLSLLWQGVVKYAQLVNARYLFGCSSVWTTENHKAAEICRWFQERDLSSNDFLISPLAKYDRNLVIPGVADPAASEFIAPLLKTYLKAGAKVHGQPAFDREFQCFDFLTILDFENFSEGFRRRFCS